MKTINMEQSEYYNFLMEYFPLEAYYNDLHIEIVENKFITLREPLTNNIIKSLIYTKQLYDSILTKFENFVSESSDIDDTQLQFKLNLKEGK